MKKKVKYIVIGLILLIIVCFFFNMFKTHHKVKYKIKDIEILETYHKDKTSDYYLLEITRKDQTFIFDIDNSFNKKKKIIKDILIYNDNDLTCIYPILINDKYNLEIECSIDHQLYSYNSIKNKYDLSKFIKSIPNYDSNYFKDQTTNISKHNDIKVYSDNLYNNENIILYDYKDLIKIKNNSFSTINFSDYDVYHNDLGILINNLYLIPKYSKKPEISSYYIIDILKEKKTELKLDQKLSTNVYINGVVDNKLYIFDKSNILQYELDPKNKASKKLGDKNSIQFYDGKWIDANPYDYLKEEKKFNAIASSIEFPFEYEQIFETSTCYYFYTKDGKFYKVYKNNLEQTILLFEYKDFKEVQLINNRFYFINNNSLYRYDKYGIKTIINRDEFKYNSRNIYSAYFE